MAAPAVHIAKGECKICGHQFTPASMTLCINQLEVINGMRHITRQRVCGKCHSAHHAKGE